MRALTSTLAGLAFLLAGEVIAGPSCDRMDTVYGGPGQWVLAMSYTPGYCKSKGITTGECYTPDPRLALHGLWPQWKIFCSVDPAQNKAASCKERDKLNPLTLSPQERVSLEDVMPAAREKLDRYEWVKHGTCSGLSEQSYFGEAIRLMKDVRASTFGYAITMSNELTGRAICENFSKSFGNNNALQIESRPRSDGKALLTGLTVGLRANHSDELELNNEHLDSAKTPSCSDNDALNRVYIIAK